MKRLKIHFILMLLSGAFLFFTVYYGKIGNVTSTSSPGKGATLVYKPIAAKDVKPVNPEDNPSTILDVSHLLRTSVITDEVLRLKPFQYLTDVKNPCFALKHGRWNIGNITISTALRNKYEIRCFPKVLLAGFTKCGSSDFYKSLMALRLMRAGVNDGLYKYKEAHFWDNMGCNEDKNFEYYSDLYPSDLIKESFKKYGSDDRGMVQGDDDLRDMMFMDGTPRYMWHGDNWELDEMNQGLEAPKVLVPHKLFHIVPQVKILAILRNPITRLFSDYRYYYTGNQTAEDFHNKVVAAIDWWEECVSRFPLRACAYGKAPGDMERLSFKNCYRTEKERLCHWDDNANAANRLRVGMYYLYIQDWLQVFPPSSILPITTDEYSKDTFDVFEKLIIPFLDHPTLTTAEEEKLKKKEDRPPHEPHFEMWPKTKYIIAKFYRPFNQKLADLTGEKKFLWEDNDSSNSDQYDNDDGNEKDD